MNSKILHFNGVNGSTGEYLLSPMSIERFAEQVQGRRLQPMLGGKGVTVGIDASNPVAAGWGIVVPPGLDSSIQNALSKLVNHRENPHFDWFTYVPGESVTAFLGRYGAAHGPVVPGKVPYYLLLIGSPEQIPFQFQESLDVQYAVGRLDFADARGYERYAQSLIAAEKQGLCRRRAVFFGINNSDDASTDLSAQHLVLPLSERCADLYPSWTVEHHSDTAASKACLHQELHASAPPAFIFTAGHAVFFPPTLVDLQRQRQGALLMSDWPGPRQWDRPVSRDHYFAAHDLEAVAQVHGLITFHFACFSGGTPHLDSFASPGEAPAIASAPFVARLPQALLSHRHGSALAVIAHVDRAWEASFLGQESESQVAVFESALRLILDGKPVGYAMEVFGQRYAELAVQLHIQRMESDEAGAASAADTLAARLWTAFHDARGYILLGDPAARLSLKDQE